MSIGRYHTKNLIGPSRLKVFAFVVFCNLVRFKNIVAVVIFEARCSRVGVLDVSKVSRFM